MSPRLYKQMANLMVGREVSFEVEKSEPHYRETVLEVKNLTVKIRIIEVVKNVSFSVHGGEVFAIAGVSGNGQIEIADAIAGVEKQLQVVFF